MTLTLKQANEKITELEIEADRLASEKNELEDQVATLKAALSTFETKLEVKRARQKARRMDPQVKANRKARRLKRALELKGAATMVGSEDYDEGPDDEDSEDSLEDLEA